MTICSVCNDVYFVESDGECIACKSCPEIELVIPDDMSGLEFFNDRLSPAFKKYNTISVNVPDSIIKNENFLVDVFGTLFRTYGEDICHFKLRVTPIDDYESYVRKIDVVHKAILNSGGSYTNVGYWWNQLLKITSVGCDGKDVVRDMIMHKFETLLNGNRLDELNKILKDLCCELFDASLALLILLLTFRVKEELKNRGDYWQYAFDCYSKEAGEEEARKEFMFMK